MSTFNIFRPVARPSVHWTRSYSSSPSPSLQRLAKRIPKGTWDSHMHVLDPQSFPISANAKYTPAAHTLDDARAFYRQIGIEKFNFVQTSVYGNDNSCILQALKDVGLNNGRAVVQFDVDQTSKEQLQQWHGIGVRGVRLNFKSVGATVDAESLSVSLHKYAKVIQDVGWVIELYISLEDIPKLEPIVPTLGNVKICIDHFGHPSDRSIEAAVLARDLPGFQSLINLLRGGKTWVKISAAYRMHQDPRCPLIQSMVRELLKARPDRCIFATDWPHTRYEHTDVGPYLEAVLDWIEDEGLSLESILVDNAEKLWDAAR